MKSNKILLITVQIFLQTISHAQELRDTPVGKLGVKIVAAINSNNKDTQRDFIAMSVDLDAGQSSADQLIQDFAKLYDETGGVDVIDMKPGRDPEEVKIALKGRKTGIAIELMTHLSREDDTRVIGFLTRPVNGELARQKMAWPDHNLSDAETIAEIERHIDAAVKEDRFSGAVLIAKGNKVVFDKAYGLANVEKNIVNQPSTKFNIGSMNKMFTAIAIAQLVEAKKLSFNDRLSKVLPDYPNKEAADNIFIHQLLTHTSGLDNFFTPEYFEHKEKYVDLKSYLPLFANEQLRFEPGKGWSYSNAGFIVLGVIVEQVSGENYFDYVRNHIFKPAGMLNTDSYNKGDAVPNMATGYDRDEQMDPQHKMPRQDNSETLPVKGSSAGGGYSTTGDMLKFTQALMSNKLLSPAMTQTVMTGKVSDRHPNSQYAYGFIDENHDGKHVVGHDGGGPGISAATFILKDNGFTVIALANYSPPAADELAREISGYLVIW